MTIELERAYAPTKHRGERFLVDRLWPRGASRDALKLDGWLKDVAPSDRLRKWFDHDPARWEEFEKRYFAELDANREALEPLILAAKRAHLVLVFAAKDEDHNNAVALREYLERRQVRRNGRGSGPGRKAGHTNGHRKG